MGEPPKWALCVTCPGTMVCSLFLLVLILAGAAGGAPALPVFGAFAVRTSDFQQRFDAYNVAQSQYGTGHSKLLSGGGDDDEDGGGVPERSQPLMLAPSRMLYEPFDGLNMLSEDGLKTVAEFEEIYMTTKDLDKHCMLVYNVEATDADGTLHPAGSLSGCASPISILSDLYLSPEKHEEQCRQGFCYLPQTSPAPPHPMAGMDISMCGAAVPWGTSPCKSSIFQWTDGTLAPPAQRQALLEALCSDANEATRKMMLSRDAKASNCTSSAYLRSWYFIGVPLKGYKSDKDRADAQLLAMMSEPWFGSTLKPALNAQQNKVSATKAGAGKVVMEKPGSGEKLNLFWEQLITLQTLDWLIADLFFAFFSVMFVFCYMWSNVGSVFLAMCGMFEIIMSIPLAMFCWSVIMQQNYLNSLEYMVVYIILGIGADDVFIFTDAWKQSYRQAKYISGSETTRFVWAYRRACNAMVVTTVTTMASFLACCISLMPALIGFGVFAALVVLFDFLLVITFYPSAVIFHHRYFADRCGAKCCGCCVPPLACLACPFPEHEYRGAPSPVSPAAVIATPPDGKAAAPAEKTEGGEAEGPKLRTVERVLSTTLADHMKVHAVKWVGGFAVIVVAFVIIAATQLRPATELAKDFPDNHPYTYRINLEGEEFPVGGGEKKETVTYIWGLDSETPVIYGGDGMPQIYPSNSDVVPNFKNGWSMDGATQQGIIDFCDAAAAKTELWKGLPDPQVYCFMKDVKTWADDEGKTFPLPAADFETEMQTWMTSTHFAQMAKRDGPSYPLLTGFGYDDAEKVAYAFVTLNTSMAQSEAGIITDDCGGTGCMQDRYDDYEALTKECKQGGACVQISFRWFWKTVLQGFEQGALSGVASAVAFAFVVLVLSTKSLPIGTLATLNVACIVITICGILPIVGYSLGILECIFLVMCVGLAVDYTVHLAHSYNEAPFIKRFDRMRHALEEVGVSVVSGAITTTGAGSALFLCTAVFFGVFGFFILFTAGLSIIYALLFFTPLMMLVGPERAEGWKPPGADAGSAAAAGPTV